jgi:hypothetical protein
VKTICGIDNGIGGSLSFYDGAELMCYRMPVFEGERKAIDVHGLIKIIETNKPTHVYVEKLTPLPKISGLTAFSMGHSEGLVLAILTCLNIPYTLVRPAVWKKAMGCGANKDSTRQRASQLMPQFAHNWPLKKDIDIAEASLIALYGFGK